MHERGYGHTKADVGSRELEMSLDDIEFVLFMTALFVQCCIIKLIASCFRLAVHNITVLDIHTYDK